MLELAKTYDVCRGEKPKSTVIFLHGIAADSSSFNGLLKYLSNSDVADELRLVAFDLLGAGKSYASDELEYNFKEQLDALSNSIDKLKVSGPVIIVAHSMGTMIATRFTEAHKRLVKGLVLLSAPIYRQEDIENPMFTKAMEGFREVVGRKAHGLLTAKSFNNEIKYIVSNPHNYDYLVRLKTPTTIIYGELDRIIASYNLPALLKMNPNIMAVKTAGSHGVTRDKYNKVLLALKNFLNEENKS